MSRATSLLKKIFLFFIALCVLLVIGIACIDPKPYLGFVEQSLIESAQSSGIQLALKQTSYSLLPPRLEAQEVSAFSPKTLLSFSTRKLRVNMGLLGLMTLAPHVRMQSELYGGELTGDLKLAIETVTYDGTLFLKQAKLREHPQIFGFGLTAGELSFSLPELHGTANGVTSAKGSIELRGVEKPKKSTLPVTLQGLNLPLSIPAFSGLEAQGVFTWDGSLFRFKNTSLKSSLGSASLSGDIPLNNTKAPALRISGEGEFSDAGVTELGAYLTLASNGNVPSTTKRFRFEASGSLRYPIWKVVARD